MVAAENMRVIASATGPRGPRNEAVEMGDGAQKRRWERATPGAAPWVAERLLGQGGQARAWLARDAGDPARRCVVKEFIDGAQAREHCRLECEALERLHRDGAGPGIVGMIERSAPNAGGDPWVALEHIEGVTLREALKAPHTLVWRLSMALALVQMVARVHQCGAAHRDLQWENVLLPNERDPATVRLIDFAFSCDAGSRTRTVMVAQGWGYAGFTSPEKADDPAKVVGRAAVDAQREDVWSLGALCYVVMSGRFPYEEACPGWVPGDESTERHHWKGIDALRERGGAALASVEQGQKWEPMRLRLRWGAALASVEQGQVWGPMGVDAVLAKALAVRPMERYANAEEFKEALLDALVGPAEAERLRAVEAERQRKLEEIEAQLTLVEKELARLTMQYGRG